MKRAKSGRSQGTGRARAKVPGGARKTRLRATLLAFGLVLAVAVWQWPELLWDFKKAPSFTLESSTGRLISLEDYRGKKEVVLVFYMGAA